MQVACAFAASSVRGARLFETQQCVRCHSVNGRGGTTAPDLGRRIGRNHTPAVLASTLWNHAPAMWSEMGRQGITPPALTAEDAADLFAYFYSARFFDMPGDAGRGKDAFHPASLRRVSRFVRSEAGQAPPVAKWQALGSPVALAEAMWNHAKGMRDEFARRGFPLAAADFAGADRYPRLSHNHPSVRRSDATFDVSSGTGGEALFQGERLP